MLAKLLCASAASNDVIRVFPFVSPLCLIRDLVHEEDASVLYHVDKERERSYECSV